MILSLSTVLGLPGWSLAHGTDYLGGYRRNRFFWFTPWGRFSTSFLGFLSWGHKEEDPFPLNFDGTPFSTQVEPPSFWDPVGMAVLGVGAIGLVYLVGWVTRRVRITPAGVPGVVQGDVLGDLPVYAEAATQTDFPVETLAEVVSDATGSAVEAVSTAAEPEVVTGVASSVSPFWANFPGLVTLSQYPWWTVFALGAGAGVVSFVLFDYYNPPPVPPGTLDHTSGWYRFQRFRSFLLSLGLGFLTGGVLTVLSYYGFLYLKGWAPTPGDTIREILELWGRIRRAAATVADVAFLFDRLAEAVQEGLDFFFSHTWDPQLGPPPGFDFTGFSLLLLFRRYPVRFIISGLVVLIVGEHILTHLIPDTHLGETLRMGSDRLVLDKEILRDLLERYNYLVQEKPYSHDPDLQARVERYFRGLIQGNRTSTLLNQAEQARYASFANAMTGLGEPPLPRVRLSWLDRGVAQAARLIEWLKS